MTKLECVIYVAFVMVILWMIVNIVGGSHVDAFGAQRRLNSLNGAYNDTERDIYWYASAKLNE